MFIYLILTENTPSGTAVKITATEREYNYLERMKHYGGYLRYNISLYDEGKAKQIEGFPLYFPDTTAQQISRFFSKINLFSRNFEIPKIHSYEPVHS